MEKLSKKPMDTYVQKKEDIFGREYWYATIYDDVWNHRGRRTGKELLFFCIN
jgi:hypothetical protein